MKMLTRWAAIALLGCLASCAVAPAIAQTDQYPDSDASSPCRHWAAITPSDGTDLTRVPKALYVGGAGDVTMIGADAPSGATGVAWKGAAAGEILPVRPRRILATGTTATDLVACY